MPGPHVSAVRAGIVVATLLGLPAFALAQPIPRGDIPPELRPWVPWVLDDVRDFGCPRVQGRAVCAWPGRLRLDLGPASGTFALDVLADRESELRLPGSAEIWPQGVTLDGRPAAVFDRGANPPAPRLHVPAGRHRIAGRFAWSRLPESLFVPPEVGLVDLRLDSGPVARPRREKSGLLWLRRRAEDAAGEGDRLRLQVFRRIEDGIPLFVETRLQLEVSGRAREVALPQALLPSTVPVSVSGDLAARVEDRALRVQVRGGRFVVRVLARVEGRPEALARPVAGEGPSPSGSGAVAWPESEVWVFAANDTLRQADLSGPPAVDPSRTELPKEWRSLPAFLVEPGGSLTLKTVRRGQPEAAPDSLHLDRTLWLDPDGRHASVRDAFSGTLHGTTRLDVVSPATLGRVAVDGQDQLVTADPATGASGVELRRTSLQMEADSRLAVGGPLPAVGWTTGVETLQSTLNVPPGWSLLAATGVDALPGTWTARWTLLGFFFVLLVAFAAHRLFGPRAAVVAAAALVLTYGEPGAPLLAWLSLLAAVALRRVAPAGRLGSLGRIWFLASAGVLVLLLVPFARDQIKDALFPQVAAHDASFAAPDRLSVRGSGGIARSEGDLVTGAMKDKASPAAAAPAPAPQKVGREAPEQEGEAPPAEMNSLEEKAPATSSLAVNAALEQDPRAIVQTGPGVPSWTWRQYTLSWTGPVGRDHTVRLFLASPGLNRLLTLLRLLLVALLAWVVLTGRWPRVPRRRAAGAAPVAAGMLAALAALAASSAGAAPQAGTPDPEILNELRTKLTRPPACAPGCVTTPSLVLRLSPGRLEVSAEVLAADEGSWAVPGPLDGWAPAEVRVDGSPSTALAHLFDGFLHVRLSPGVHRVEASGPVPPGDSFTLQFADMPRRARADSPGWEPSGLRADGPPDASVLFTRSLTRRTGTAAEGRYAPWLEITRTLAFGVSWTVETTVRRVSPPGTPVAVRVPLVPGEAPTRASLTVDSGEVPISLGADERETSWHSTLERAPSLTLHAPEDRPWSEVWRLQCSPVWSCGAEGVPPVERSRGGVLEPEFRPWPGESLEVSLAHPAGVEGRTLTLDGVHVGATPGTRLERVTLRVSARSSREQPLRLGLPEAADVQQVLVDGDERPLRPDAGTLRVSVPAGSHTIEVRWQQERGMGLRYAMPRVDLSAPAVDVRQTLSLPPSRWLLATWGPAWGPAVLFWPYLVFLLAVAWGLSRLPGSPLALVQWILLGLGLSQLPALGALVVAGFVLALALRRRRQPSSALAFDLMQAGLVLWALVSLVLLYLAIQQGLLFRPDMQVAGPDSSDTALAWYADRVEAQTPSAGVLSLPLWTYRVAMLLWALWLAASLVRAVGWGWGAFGEDGLWRRLVLRRASPPAAPPPTDVSPKDVP